MWRVERDDISGPRLAERLPGRSGPVLPVQLLFYAPAPFLRPGE